MIITDIFHSTQNDSCLCLLVVIIFDCMSAYGCSHFSICKNESAFICLKNTIICMFLCASMRKRSVCCTVCLTALSVSVSARMCVRACMPVRRRGGRAGIKHTRSTSQRLGGPSPALMATHVNSKNRSVEHNTLTHTDIHTHAPVSTQRITVCQSRQCLVACLRPTLNTTTHIFPRNRQVLWTGTTGLRTGQKGIATVTPHHHSSLHATSHLCKKKTSALKLRSCFCQKYPVQRLHRLWFPQHPTQQLQRENTH